MSVLVLLRHGESAWNAANVFTGWIDVGLSLAHQGPLDILVPDHDAEAMVDAIAWHARTGAIGDGKIWTSDVDSVRRVRTSERDDADFLVARDRAGRP